jgi:hypothetical protein
VVLAAAMTTGGHGEKLALTRQTALDLTAKYGLELVNNFLKEMNLYGGNYQALTEPEAYALLHAGSLDAARAGILEAGFSGGREIHQGTVNKNVGIEPEAYALLHARPLDVARARILEAGFSGSREIHGGTAQKNAGIKPEGPARTGGIDDPAGFVRSPEAPYGIKVKLAAMEAWAAERFPPTYRRYAAYKNHPSGSSKLSRLDYDGLKTDLISAYKILHLKQFDRTAYEQDIKSVVTTQGYIDHKQKYIFLGYLPAPYQNIGLAQLPVFVTKRHIYLAANQSGIITDHKAHYHNLPLETLLNLPDMLKNPRGIINLNTRDSRVLAIFDKTNREGNPLVVPLVPYGIYSNLKNNAIKFPAIITLSCYGLEQDSPFLDPHYIANNLIYTQREDVPHDTPWYLAPRAAPKGTGDRTPDIVPRQTRQDNPAWAGNIPLTDNITRYKSVVNSLYKMQSLDSSFSVHESEPSYGGPLNTPQKEPPMSDVSNPSNADLDQGQRRIVLEYLDKLLDIPLTYSFE